MDPSRALCTIFSVGTIICLQTAPAASVQAPGAPSPAPSPTTAPTPGASPSPAPPTAAPAPNGSDYLLDPWLSSPTLWQTTTERFPSGRALGFRWVSTAHDTARSADLPLHLRNLPVAEVIARFAAPANNPAAPTTPPVPGAPLPLSAVQISIYNRGDVGEMDQKHFEALVGLSKEALDSLTGVASTDRGTDTTSAVQSRGLVWSTPTSRFVLEWSARTANQTPSLLYRAEFVRLKIFPQTAPLPRNTLEAMRAASAPAGTPARVMTIRASELPGRVVKDADGGEVLPNIPMVDQGDKGYCVTAATERVLRYYGVETDQNELAQIANTDADSGTSTTVMVAALKKLASRFRVNVITELQLNYQDFMREIDDYNRVVRAAPKGATVPLINSHNGMVSYQGVMSKVDGEILREARTKLNPAYMGRFEHEVQGRLDRGIPLLWSVTLGVLPEPGLKIQTRGGHMRLIIGYNPKSKTVYYSDTWGLGHELKKMPLADAWTITDGLFTLEPL